MLSKFAIYIIKFYQVFISPYIGSRCRFYPTCSQYAIEVFNEWGFLKGMKLTFKRILKCGPWNSGGYDPPPVKIKK